MANILAAAAGVYNVGATWIGGVAPGVGDVAICNGYVVTVPEGTHTCAEWRNDTTGGATEGGSFLIDPAGGAIVINANLIGSATTLTFNTANDLVQVNSARVSSITINGNIIGWTWVSNPEVTRPVTNKVLRLNASCTVVIVGNVAGGGWAANLGCIYIQAASVTLTVTGYVTNTGGAVTIYSNSASTSVTVNGEVYSEGKEDYWATDFVCGARATVANQVIYYNSSATNSTLVINGNLAAYDGVVVQIASTVTLTITGELYMRGVQPCLSVSSAFTAITINGNVWGELLGFGGATNSACISVAYAGVLGTFTINGNVYGSVGPYASQYGGITFQNVTTGTLTVNGTLYGRGTAAIYVVTASCNVVVVCNEVAHDPLFYTGPVFVNELGMKVAVAPSRAAAAVQATPITTGTWVVRTKRINARYGYPINGGNVEIIADATNALEVAPAGEFLGEMARNTDAYPYNNLTATEFRTASTTELARVDKPISELATNQAVGSGAATIL